MSIDFGIKPKRDDEGRLRISQEPRKIGEGRVMVTHNWCDPTTWYTQSERALLNTLDDSGDGLTFLSDHPNWIDLTHGKVYCEDLISNLYLPTVKVNDVVMTERIPWADSGGDFTINYDTGHVTFFVSQAGNTVTADYSWENGSLFILAPANGKRLWVEYSEVQFSKDIEVNSSIYFQPWAYSPTGDPAPPTKIPAADPTVYKTLDNFIEEANGCYPEIPIMGGPRGFTSPRITFPFKYQTVKELYSSYGAEIRVWLDSTDPLGGEYGTATFYCTCYEEEAF